VNSRKEGKMEKSQTLEILTQILAELRLLNANLTKVKKRTPKREIIESITNSSEIDALLKENNIELTDDLARHLIEAIRIKRDSK
jgi:hypothetical protein